MRLAVLLATVAFGMSTLAARADTFQTFDLNATILGEGTVTGTVNLDLSSTISHDFNDSVANLTFTSTDKSTVVQFTGNDFSFGDTFSPATVSLTFYNSSKTSHFVLMVPVTTVGSLAGFNGGLCTELSGTCGSFDAAIYLPTWNDNVFKGTFAPEVTAATPEPASLALLATGLLGLAGPVRRRLYRTA